MPFPLAANTSTSRSLRWFILLLHLVALGAGAQAQDTPREECEALLNNVLPMAEGLLRKHGEFYPYGGAMRSDGEIISLAANDGREQPPAADIVTLLKSGFREGANSGEYKATALVYDASVIIPTTKLASDAIAVSLNHRDNYSVIVLLPYEIKDGALQWGETFTQEGEADIFPTR